MFVRHASILPQGGLCKQVALLIAEISLNSNNYEKLKIQNSAEEYGYTVIKIKYLGELSNEGEGPARFNVVYKDEDGREQECICKTRLFGTVHWD